MKNKNEKKGDKEQKIVLKPREEFDLLSNKSGTKEPPKKNAIKKIFKDKGDNL